MKAVLIGATGLVGSEILKVLLDDARFSEVRALGRSATEMNHSKLVESIIDFENPSTWKNEIQGDVLFLALGTTLKQAGSQTTQYRVDHDYTLEVARAAYSNGVRRVVSISSVGAHAQSKIFYLRMKGEIEAHLAEIGFDAVTFVRPGPLVGNRKHPRWSERVSHSLLSLIPEIPGTEKIRPVEGEHVAEVCVELALESHPSPYIVEPREIFAFS